MTRSAGGAATGGAAKPSGPDPTVLAIVLNYDGRDLTLQTVASLLASDYPALAVAVVDNGSTDGSDEAVAARFPSVQRLRTPENLGISGGLNLGIRAGLAQGHAFLMLCNNDLEVAPDMVRELVAAAGADPRAGCVGPKCYYYFGERDRIWSAGGTLRWREAVTRERGMGERDRGQFDRDGDVDYVNGACMLVRREAMLATGLWDPVYHVAVEDADWCVRMRAAGWTAVTPIARVSGTWSRRRPAATRRRAPSGRRARRRSSCASTPASAVGSATCCGAPSPCRPRSRASCRAATARRWRPSCAG
jgi:GT2 family glycosyltransferase